MQVYTSDIRTYPKRPAHAVVRAICASGRVVRCEREWTRNARYVDDAGEGGGGEETRTTKCDFRKCHRLEMKFEPFGFKIKIDLLSTSYRMAFLFRRRLSVRRSMIFA